MNKIIPFLALMLFSATLLAQDTENAFLASSPSISPDGKTIIFSWRDDICKVSIDGGMMEFVTKHPAKDLSPVYSPDGKKIAFSSNRSGNYQVYTMDVDGSLPRQVTFHSAGSDMLDWFKDNDHVLTMGRRDHRWRRNNRMFEVSTLQRLNEKLIVDAEVEYAQLSPDGKKLVLTREGTEWWRKGYHGSRASQIWVYDIANDYFTPVFMDGNDYRWPIWAADGESIYYVACIDGSDAHNLWQYDFDDQTKKQITFFDDDIIIRPCISSDGKTIVFRHLFDLYKLQLDKNPNPVKIEILKYKEDDPDAAKNQIIRSASSPAFTDDALEIAFVSNRDIYFMDTELKEPVSLAITPAMEESEPIFSADNKSLFFLRDNGVTVDIFKATPAEPEKYWWQNQDFNITQLTDDNAIESSLTLSPDGKSLAFCHKRDGLWVCDIDGQNKRQIIESWDTIDFSWSPDSKWIACSVSSNDLVRDIWIVSVDGSCEPYNVSKNPRGDWNPTWSPDGKILAYCGWEIEDQQDIYYVYLEKQQQDISPRTRTIEKAIKKMKDKRKDEKKPEPKANAEPEKEADQSKEQQNTEDPAPETESANKDAEKKESEDKDKKSESKEKNEKLVKIDFDDLDKRVKRITTKDIREYWLFWSPDSKKLIFTRVAGSSKELWQLEFPDKIKPTKFSSSGNASNSRWLEKVKGIVCLYDNVPALMSTSGSVTKYPFTIKSDFDKKAWYEYGFRTIWRMIRDDYYDPDLNGRNWDTILAKYQDKAIKAQDLATFRRVVSLMLGELNGSHLGLYGSDPTEWKHPDQWKTETAHLGARFDYKYQGPGVKIRDILPDSPAENENTRLYPGEIITHIDDTEITENMDLTLVLNGKVDRDINLKVTDTDGQSRDVTLRPISYGSIREMLQKHAIEISRQQVETATDDKVGYIYIPRMMWDEFKDFEKTVYAEGLGKDGLIIDVRGNTGGFVADHLLTVLCQPRYAYIIPRGGDVGYNDSRSCYTTWYKPIVVLCDQDTFSNGEIFSHAIKYLKRGPLVGVATGGNVISTRDQSVLGFGTLRHPFIGWFMLDTNKDMELNGAVPDYTIWPMPGDIPSGKDDQLKKAIELLKK
ncbi:MAG: PD40 domain-containing protein [Phycisphaerae bacterium]|nr:PD40 domain-containing protein [Phycisphaerae bacterium]